MLQTKITPQESLEVRHSRLKALNEKNRAISIEDLVAMSNNAGMPLISRYKNIGELVDSSPADIQSIEYMGNKKINMIYETLERLLSEQNFPNQTQVEIPSKSDETPQNIIQPKHDNVTPIQAAVKTGKPKGKGPIVISPGAEEILEAMYKGCDAEIFEGPEGEPQAKIYVRFLAPVKGRDGTREMRIVGAATGAPKAPSGTTADIKNAKRADKWKGKDSKFVSVSDVAMLFRAGLVDIEDESLVLTEDADAYCYDKFGQAVDYTVDETFEYDPDLEEDFRAPAIEVGENPDFNMKHVEMKTNILNVRNEKNHLILEVPGEKKHRSKPIDLKTADSLARFFNRAMKVQEDCGIRFDGVAAEIKDGKIILRFDTAYPDPYVFAEVTMGPGNSGSLADQMLEVSLEEPVDMSIIHVDARIIDMLAYDPDELRV